MPLFGSALVVGLVLCLLGHFKLISEAAFHFLGCLALGADSVVLLFELGHFSLQFLAGGLRAVVQNLGLGDLSCELVQDLLVLH